MKKLMTLAAMAMTAATFTGCGAITARVVTAHSWVELDAGTHYFVAYYEGQGSVSRSAVKRCKFVDEENVLACREDKDLIQALNPVE